MEYHLVPRIELVLQLQLFEQAAGERATWHACFSSKSYFAPRLQAPTG